MWRLEIEVSLNVLREAVGSLGDREGFVGESRVCLESFTIMFCILGGLNAGF